MAQPPSPASDDVQPAPAPDVAAYAWFDRYVEDYLAAARDLRDLLAEGAGPALIALRLDRFRADEQRRWREGAGFATPGGDATPASCSPLPALR